MRVPATVLFVLSLVMAPGSAAAGEIHEPHAMLYYHVPFSGSADDERAAFGLRFDQTLREEGQPLDYAGLLRRPALLGFEAGASGWRTFTLAGNTVYHADGGEDSGSGPEAEKEDGV